MSPIGVRRAGTRTAATRPRESVAGSPALLPHALRRSGSVAAVLVAALLLSACAGPGTSVGGSNPAPTERRLESVDPSAISLPTGLGDADVLQPGWDLPPQELDGVFVGQHLGESGWLEFTAVDEDGKVLWLAERPPSCTGYALARTEDGRPIAILTNLVATQDAIAAPTATAFDLRTGEQVWGPVDVAGPYKGPGLVFAAAPEGFMGDTGEKIALDPSDGRVIATEAEDATRRIVGEFRGALISVDTEQLTAERPNGDGALEPVWSLPLAGQGWDSVEISNQARRIDLGEQYIVIPSGEDTLAVLELATGEVIVNHARDVGFDKQSGTLVLLTATEILGVSESGWSWSHPSPEQATPHGIGSGLAYFRDGGPHFVLDLSDGSLATPEFQGAPASAAGPFLPTHTTERGAAIVENGPIRYLVTRD